MSGRLPYIKRRKYPHMTGEDFFIWNRFITRFPDYFETVDYDWRVGDGMKLDPTWEDNFKRMAKAITQKRIDVLGWNGDLPTIVELKRSVGLSTLGQVLGYKTLLMNEFPYFGTPKLLVLTEQIGEDDQLVMDKFKVRVMVV